MVNPAPLRTVPTPTLNLVAKPGSVLGVTLSDSRVACGDKVSVGDFFLLRGHVASAQHSCIDVMLVVRLFGLDPSLIYLLCDE